jgi:arsenate reductase
MRQRVGAFASLPIRSIDRLALGSKLREIGRMEGATHPGVDSMKVG